MDNNIKLRFIVFIFLTLLIVGTMGYSLLLKTSIIDSLYMTIITISTVGYSEIAIMTPAAKIFSMVLILCGVGIGGYTFTTFVGIIIDGKIKDLWRNRMIDNKILRLNDHYILCGAGEVGEVIIEDFIKEKVNFVVIEKNESKYKNISDRGVLAILGDATDDVILKRAQIHKSKGLITALSKDSDNIVTVLTARHMNKDLYIISRSIDKSAPDKLKKAGANRTLSPNEIGGSRMSAQMIKPSVISFLDVVTRIGNIEFYLEDIIINDKSELIGKSIKELRSPKHTGLVVVAIKKEYSDRLEDMRISPNPDDLLHKGDILLVMGTTDQIERIRKLANRS